MLRNNRDGTFSGEMRYAADGDNDLDLIVSNLQDDDILLNNGNGTFAGQFTASAGLGPIGIATGDLDGLIVLAVWGPDDARNGGARRR